MGDKWAIVTGAGSGIGRALSIELASHHQINVLAVGRRLQNLQETQQQNPQRITVLQADVANEAGREQIFRQMERLGRVAFLIHNAAQLQPVKPLSKVTLEEWRSHFAVNVEGPLFLTQKILPLMETDGRILHISSGAAHHPYAGWGAYCTSKAALFMLYQVLNRELNEQNIWVGSLRPGVVNTPMQDEVRQARREEFPALERFIQLKKEGKLLPPGVVAQFIAQVLLTTSNEQFVQKEWDIREHGAQFGLTIEQ